MKAHRSKQDGFGQSNFAWRGGGPFAPEVLCGVLVRRTLSFRFSRRYEGAPFLTTHLFISSRAKLICRESTLIPCIKGCSTSLINLYLN